ncbi:hypothetical protein [Pseudomonas sp. SO81]|nr:hypothetical protein [Pseudomonas sp. SO81]WJN61728.1 hypothetical protein OH686_23560 [Pseudomonas sp. SO81]
MSNEQHAMQCEAKCALALAVSGDDWQAMEGQLIALELKATEEGAWS